MIKLKKKHFEFVDEIEISGGITEYKLLLYKYNLDKSYFKKSWCISVEMLERDNPEINEQIIDDLFYNFKEEYIKSKH